MKKYLPLILLVLGLLVFVGVFSLLKSKGKEANMVDEDKNYVLELSNEEKPIVYLIPSPDGHYINLIIENLNFNANKLFYEFIYKDGELQRGSYDEVDITEKEEFRAELLLGSESSGVIRFDEGVETGSLILQFRDNEGDLMVKPFTTSFHLQDRSSELTSLGGEFVYMLNIDDKGDFFITMENFGEPDPNQVLISKDGYSVFSSDKFVKKSSEE